MNEIKIMPFKRWHYGLSNVLVDCSNHHDVFRERFRWGAGDDNSNLDFHPWCKVIFRFEGFRDFEEYSAIIGEFEDAESVIIRDWYSEMQWSEVESSMLIFNIERTQHPEGMAYKVLPGLVGLQVTDSFLGRFRKVSNTIFERGLMLEKNGETDICSAVALQVNEGLRETPDQMVKGGYHVVNGITKDWHERSYSGRQYPSFVNVHLPIRIVGMDKTMRIVVTECQSFGIKVIDVQFGPIELDDSAIESFHQLQSGYEKEIGQQTEANNSTGARDSRAHKGRVRDESKQGGEPGDEITDSPPEEELTRTSPGHRLGGYTATHTRSGSPEDALRTTDGRPRLSHVLAQYTIYHAISFRIGLEVFPNFSPNRAAKIVINPILDSLGGFRGS